MTAIYDRARNLLASTWVSDQPVPIARRANELRFALREPLTPGTTRALLSLLADLDAKRMPRDAVEERDAVAREIVGASEDARVKQDERWTRYLATPIDEEVIRRAFADWKPPTIRITVAPGAEIKAGQVVTIGNDGLARPMPGPQIDEFVAAVEAHLARQREGLAGEERRGHEHASCHLLRRVRHDGIPPASAARPYAMEHVVANGRRVRAFVSAIGDAPFTLPDTHGAPLVIERAPSGGTGHVVEGGADHQHETPSSTCPACGKVGSFACVCPSACARCGKAIAHDDYAFGQQGDAGVYCSSRCLNPPRAVSIKINGIETAKDRDQPREPFDYGPRFTEEVRRVDEDWRARGLLPNPPVEVKVGQRWRNGHGHSGTVATVDPEAGVYLGMDGVVGLAWADPADLRRGWTLVADVQAKAAPESTPALASAVDPGAGWRLLDEGETIREGDMGGHAGGALWVPVGSAMSGQKWGAYLHLPVRRRVEGPQVGETWRRREPFFPAHRVLAVEGAWVRFDSALGDGIGFRARLKDVVERWQRVEENRP